MKILFLTLVYSSKGNSIYKDLIDELCEMGNEVFVVSTVERREKKSTYLNSESKNLKVLNVKTLNVQKTNIFEKGIGILTLERSFINAINKYYKKEKFDLILYSTPPITFEKVISFVKKRDKAKTYLLLKDIFPQNAVDLKMFRKKSFLYKFFRRKEKKLYKLSDYIGCMSPKNVEYLVKNNMELNEKKIEVCPNSIKPTKYEVKDSSIRSSLGIKENELLVLYGGNLGKPQGIDFLLDVLGSNKNNNNIKFIIVGNGTEKERVFNFVSNNNIKNVILKEKLPKNEYDNLVRESDLGLIFLDKNFTIPNFPSRLLGYMDAKIPVLAATDINTDLGQIIEENNLGYWCESSDLERFNYILDKCVQNRSDLLKKGEKSRKYLEDNYTAKHSAKIILKHFS